MGRLKAVPGEYQAALRNFGGGYVNHCLFFKALAPPAPRASADEPVPMPRPTGVLSGAIDQTYGSFENFQKLFTQVLCVCVYTCLLGLNERTNVVQTVCRRLCRCSEAAGRG